jgi:HCOMODA/2-hydroxy-3-carboxy-muconic semialdehyde decarboxylase
MKSQRILRSSSLAVVVIFGAVTAIAQQRGAASTQALKEELALANRILANEGVLDGYGHVSLRSPANRDRYYLSRSKAPGLVTAADIIEYTLDSTPAVSTTATAYIERFIHGEIYRARSDVMAIVHCHCPEVIPFAATSIPMQPLYHMSSFVAQGVPVFDIQKAAGMTDMLIRTPELGRALAGTLGSGTAALMRGHGAVIAAASLHLVVGQAYYLNLNARLQLQAIQLGGANVKYLDRDEANKAANDYERSWDFWKSRLPRP